MRALEKRGERRRCIINAELMALKKKKDDRCSDQGCGGKRKRGEKSSSRSATQKEKRTHSAEPNAKGKKDRGAARKGGEGEEAYNDR